MYEDDFEGADDPADLLSGAFSSVDKTSNQERYIGEGLGRTKKPNKHERKNQVPRGNISPVPDDSDYSEFSGADSDVVADSTEIGIELAVKDANPLYIENTAEEKPASGKSVEVINPVFSCVVTRQ